LKASREEAKRLEWRDWVAIIIGMLTTTLLPLLILILVLIAALIIAMYFSRSTSLLSLIVQQTMNH
jgi:small-conductance mechanosensitive channel